MKFTRFLNVFLSLFFILIGMEKAFGMEPVSEKCEVCHKGECNFYVFDVKLFAGLKKVCGWNCAVNYINKFQEEIGDKGLILSYDSKCSDCKSKLLDKNGGAFISNCGHVLCENCRDEFAKNKCYKLCIACLLINLNRSSTGEVVLCSDCKAAEDRRCVVCHYFGSYPFEFTDCFHSNNVDFTIIETHRPFVSDYLSMLDNLKGFRDFLKANMNKIEINVDNGVSWWYNKPDGQIASLAILIKRLWMKNFSLSVHDGVEKAEGLYVYKFVFHVKETGIRLDAKKSLREVILSDRRRRRYLYGMPTLTNNSMPIHR